MTWWRRRGGEAVWGLCRVGLHYSTLATILHSATIEEARKRLPIKLLLGICFQSS
jgi:hypothetical protein